MSNPLSKKEFVQRLARHMQSDEATAQRWLDGMTETILQTIGEGRGITLQGLGGFYVRGHRDSTAFKFNPGSRLRAILGWSSTHRGD